MKRQPSRGGPRENGGGRGRATGRRCGLLCACCSRGPPMGGSSRGCRSLALPLLALLCLLLPALVFLGRVAQREAEGLHGRSAHAHTVVTLGDGQGGSARSHEMIRPRPSGVTASAPPLLLGQPPPPPADSLRPTDGGLPRFLQPGASQLVFNEPAIRHLAANAPSGSIPATTLHFTFGSAVMMDFVKNWLHFAGRAGLSPLLVGTADSGLLDFCNSQTVPAAAISPELDVWTYKRKERAKQAVYEIKSEWKYFRHHNSDFLEMGLVKARRQPMLGLIAVACLRRVLTPAQC
eukprot:scaffold265671_cov31-Tisochrysis_lutea.AAC.1